MSVVEWALQLPDRHEQVIGAKAEATRERSMKAGEIGNSMEINLRETSLIGLSQTEGRQEKHSLRERLKCLLESKTCKHFTYDVLESATFKFSEEKLVGKGGCSKVYRGVLPDGQSVAVKLLNFSPEAEEELLSEVEIITSWQHKNIIVLIGYCIYGEERFLVYNFVSRGNLEENLHVEKGKPVIPWKKRLKVAVGVAEALDYLHDSCNRHVIHRDVKSSNILLFDDFEPQLSDFGLAKWASTTTSHIICNDVVGTFGYLAPEYFIDGKVNEKTDVDELIPLGQDNEVNGGAVVMDGLNMGNANMFEFVKGDLLLKMLRTFSLDLCNKCIYLKNNTQSNWKHIWMIQFLTQLAWLVVCSPLLHSI